MTGPFQVPAAPEQPPEAPVTTTGVTVERVTITQETPDLTGVLVLWGFSILAAAGIMAATWWRRRGA